MNEKIKHCIPYQEKTEGLKPIKVKKGAGDFGWNKHLPVPLKNEEIVYVHPDQSEVSPGYIKIIQVVEEYKISATFNTRMFIFD
jgi:hypothetical protein